MTEEYAQISRGAKGDKELYFYIFMAIFWPTLLVTGLFAHFVFSGYELRLPTFLLSVIAGLAGVRIYWVRANKDSASR